METQEATMPAEMNLIARDTKLMLVVLNPKILFALKKADSDYKKIVDNNTFVISDRGVRTYPGDSNKNYLTDVYKEKKMSWEISLNDPLADKDYKVSLVDVIGDARDFFVAPGPVLYLGEITGEIKSNPVMGTEKSYTITFTITRNDGKTNVIEVDPKLKVIT